MKKKPKVKPLKPQDNPELQRLCAQIGKFIEYWGFKRLHGEIWAYLFLSARPLNTRELLQLTRVSKGLMSRAIGELLEHAVILEEGKGLNGISFYRANPRASEVIAEVLKARERALIGEIESTFEGARGLQAFSREAPIPVSADRAETMRSWIALAAQTLDGFFSLVGTTKDPFNEIH